MNFKCLICSSFKTDHYKEIRYHFKNHFPSNYEVKYDKKPFSLEFIALRSFLSRAQVTRSYQLQNSCSLCFKNFIKYSELIVHLKSTNHSNKLNMLIRNLKTGNLNSKFLKSKSAAFKLHCQICKFNTNHLKNLKRHSKSTKHIILTKLYNFLKNKSSISKPITFKCNICNYNDTSLARFLWAHFSLKCFIIVYGSDLKENFRNYKIRLFKVMFKCEFEWNKPSK